MQFSQNSEKIDEMVGQFVLALKDLESSKAELSGITKITPTEETSG